MKLLGLNFGGVEKKTFEENESESVSDFCTVLFCTEWSKELSILTVLKH